MTSSETQTKARKAQKAPGRKAGEEAAGPDGEPQGRQRARELARVSWMIGGVALAAGWLLILNINRWHMGPPVLFLWLGWLAIVLTARFLWNAGMSAAYDEDSEVSDEDFWKPVGRRDELVREKRALLKALKEIEFDHEMGKMSDQDAEELSQFYRGRAIELIKALESGDRDLSIPEKIEQEIKARLSLASAGGKAASDKARKKAKEPNGKTDSDNAAEGAGASAMTDKSANKDESAAASAEVGS